WLFSSWFIYESCLKTPAYAPSIFPLTTPPDSRAMHRWMKKYSEGLDNYICITKEEKKESYGFLAMRAKGILKVRVGRNVDGIDLDLYPQSLKLLRQFQSDQISHLEQLQ
ncbi:hypothetical protein Ccrd_018477, partial [Cynara cardunculus var. scolymus]